MRAPHEPVRAEHAGLNRPDFRTPAAETRPPRTKVEIQGRADLTTPILGALSTATLAACGGAGDSGNSDTQNSDKGQNQNNNQTPGGGDTSNPDANNKPDPNQQPDPPPPAPPATETEAARFLMQAAFGGTYAQVQEVQNKGYAQWIDEQMAMPWDGADSHYQWLFDKGYFDGRTRNVQEIGIDNTLWRKLMSAPDVLRQRVAYSLSQIFVVSLNGLGAILWRNMAVAAYMDLLEKNAFGKYADLLKAVSLSPAMGTYLNMKGSKAQITGSANQPDENYAREVMQLFSIGLYELNEDGTEKSPRKETYTQENVTQLARIFTGWDFPSRSPDPSRTMDSGPDFPLTIPAPFDKDLLDYFNQPMENNIKFFTPGKKSFFDQEVSSTASAKDALYQVMDYLAAHPNVGPFIGKQLIQRLVCSNPSPAYVARITKVFNEDENKVRGNLKAVVKAILLDPEARTLPSPGTDAYNGYGRLREPVLRLVQWARTFKAKSNAASDAKVNYQPTNSNLPTGPWQVGDLSDDFYGLGQSPFRSPSVFNFYRPGYVPPQGDLAAKKITAPEFQICNEVTVAKYLNLLYGAINTGRNDVVADYSADYALAKDAIKLVDRYALLLAANGLSDSTKKTISDAVATQVADTDANCLLRIKATIFMIMATPEYMVQK